MSTYQILLGDCRATLAQLATGSVQTCISSPPYWNLRDYGHAGQIGLEAVPDCLAWARQEPPCGGCFVCEMRSVYGAELRRVLANDGTVWVNLGDTYSGSRCGGNNSISTRAYNEAAKAKLITRRHKAPATESILADKNLLGLPWRVALALQADGWILRNEIIWHKPAVMPEGVKDRCTRDHEHLFLLAKQSRYYFDYKAILEPTTGTAHRKASLAALAGQEARKVCPKAQAEGYKVRNNASWQLATGDVVEERLKRTVWRVSTSNYKGAHFATFPPALITPCVLAGSRVGDTVLDLFNGSGTTGQVALTHGRRYVGCEINPDYIDLTHKRLALVQPVLQFGKEVAAV